MSLRGTVTVTLAWYGRTVYRTLGGGSTGGAVAVPMFDPIIHAVWANAASKTELAPPSPEAERQLACKSIDLESGDVRIGRGRAFSECFRVNAKGKVLDTQYLLLSGKAAQAKRDGEVSPSRKRARQGQGRSEIREAGPRGQTVQQGRARQPRQRSCSEPLFVE